MPKGAKTTRMEPCGSASWSFRVAKPKLIGLSKKKGVSGNRQNARMVKLADTADLKSVDPQGLWGFKSPFGHQ